MGRNIYTKFNHIPNVCYACGGIKKTVNGRGSPNWILNWDKDFNMLCHYCYGKIIKYPNERPQRLEEYKKLIRFGNLKRQIKGTFRQLTGYCSKCPKNIFDGSCKTTHMHHLFYIMIIPWFGRAELCASCHAKETWQEWQWMKGRIKKK